MSDIENKNGDSISNETVTADTSATTTEKNEVTESHGTVSSHDEKKDFSSNGDDDNNEEAEEGDAIDDLFGDDDDDEDNEGKNGSDEDEDEEDDVNTNRRRRIDMDEEEEMYTRKFYGEDVNNLSDQDDNEHPHHFKEQDVELVRHMVPYKVTSGKQTDEEPIYYAKVPAFLMIDPIAFDPPTFEEKVKTRLSDNTSSREDQLGERLIDENTVRWRYSRDSNQKVFRESNTQIIQWSDGSFSLKVGDEYTDILVNDTDNTFLTVSHDEQELMQCVDGGEVKKTLMLIPTSTNSKIHQRLSHAVARRAKRQNTGPGTYLINVDPEMEKEELEKKQQQIIRDRRRRQMKERELLESPDTTMGSHQGSFGRRSATPSHETARRGRSSREDEYEEDDFLVDDDEDEEFNSERDDDEEEEEEEEEEQDDAAEEAEERARAARLAATKRSGSAMYEDSQEEDSQKKRKVAVISDDEDE